MEPRDLLDGAGDEPPASTDELRQIVARAAQRRWRLGAGVAAVALCAGGGVGYALSNHSSPAQTVVAGSANNNSPSTGAPAAVNSSAAGAAAAGGAVGSMEPAFRQKFDHLFTRTTGDITIRAFVMNPAIPPGVPTAAGCGISFFTPRVQVEVSTPQMVGTSLGLQTGSTRTIKSVQAETLGTPEGEPITVVTVQTSPAVTAVKFVGANGSTDQMAPVQGWAALAIHYGLSTKPASLGTLSVAGSNGHVLGSQAVEPGLSPLPGPLPAEPACTCPPVSFKQVFGGGAAGSSGTASTGSGVSSGGAVSSSGTVSSGGAVSNGGGVSSQPAQPPASTGVICPQIKAPSTKIPAGGAGAQTGPPSTNG